MSIILYTNILWLLKEVANNDLDSKIIMCDKSQYSQKNSFNYFNFGKHLETISDILVSEKEKE